jgi:hypothetical protein
MIRRNVVEMVLLCPLVLLVAYALVYMSDREPIENAIPIRGFHGAAESGLHYPPPVLRADANGVVRWVNP